MPPPEQLADVLGKMGIDEKTPVAVYGDADKSMGGEGWITWVILGLGHEGPIRVVAGGIQSWKDHGYPVTAGPRNPARPASACHIRLRPEINVETQELESKVRPFTLMDCRSNREWIMGHIPGAVRIPWTEFRSGRQNMPLNKAALGNLLKSHGLHPGRPVVFYCTAGVRSGYTWMVHQLDGLTAVRNYLGGREDWRLRKTWLVSARKPN